MLQLCVEINVAIFFYRGGSFHCEFSHLGEMRYILPDDVSDGADSYCYKKSQSIYY